MMTKQLQTQMLRIDAPSVRFASSSRSLFRLQQFKVAAWKCATNNIAPLIVGKTGAFHVSDIRFTNLIGWFEIVSKRSDKKLFNGLIVDCKWPNIKLIMSQNEAIIDNNLRPAIWNAYANWNCCWARIKLRLFFSLTTFQFQLSFAFRTTFRLMVTIIGCWLRGKQHAATCKANCI